MKSFLFISALSGLVACGGSASTGITAVSCGSDSTLTYANFGSAFMADNCLSCHAERVSPHFTTQAQVKGSTENILQVAVYTDAMPANGPIAIEERKLLGEWLACGAP